MDDSDLTFDSDKLSKMTGTKRRELLKHLGDLKSKLEINLNKSKDVSDECDLLLEELEKIEEDKKLNPPKRGRKPKQ